MTSVPYKTIHELVGTLFEPADPDDLAGRTADLLERPDRQAVGEEGRARVVAHWSLERLAERHVEVYETLLQKRSP